MVRKRPSEREAGQRLLLGALLGMTFLLGCFPMGDFDVWWHLRTGQLILERGEIPRTDWLTYTNADRAWIDLYWLFQVGLALLYRMGGVSALVLLKACGGVAVVALWLVSRRKDAPAWPAVVVGLPTVLMLTGRLVERPELMSLVFLAGFLAVLWRAAERPRLLWLLPLLQVLWVNCHGYFVFGPLVLAAYAVEVVYRRLRPTPDAPGPTVRTFALASAATLLACVVSPYGPRALSLPLEQSGKLGGGLYSATVGELKTVGDFVARAGVNNPYLLAYFVTLALGVLSFVLVLRRGQRSPFRALLFLGGATLGWQATRNSSLFAVVAAFTVTWNLDDWTASARAKAGRRQRRNPNLALLAVVAALALAVLTGGLYRWAGEGRTVGLGERKGWYAHDACRFLARPGLPERIVAYNLGQAAVCIMHTAPSHKQFIDPRLEVNRQETFERYLAGMRKLLRNEAGWEAPLGIDYERTGEMPALLIERGPLGLAAKNLVRDPRWRLVYVDAVATAFVATAVAERLGLASAIP